MEKVYSDHKLETFQHIGPVFRIHWNHEQYQTLNLDGNTRLGWRCEEIVVPDTISREEVIRILRESNALVDSLMTEWI